MGPHGKRGGEVVQQARQIKILHLQVELLRLNLGEIENVVDQAEQRFATYANNFSKTSLLVVKFGIKQQPGHANDPIYRSSDFMAHVGQKLAFGGACHLGPHRHLVRPFRGLLKMDIGLFEFRLRQPFFSKTVQKSVKPPDQLADLIT